MSKQKEQTRINQCLKLTSNQFRKDFNSIRLNIHNTLSHELAKCLKAYELIKDGKQILTEVIFKNGKRADILIPSEFRVWEILESETEKEVLTKTESYPFELDVCYCYAKDILKVLK